MNIKKICTKQYSYYVNANTGLFHRADGPAVEWFDGLREWWINGKLHREDGPARTFPNGYCEYYLDGIRYSQKEYLAIKKFGSFV